MKRKLFGKADFWVLTLLILLCGGGLLWQSGQGSEDLTAVITVDGEVLETVKLDAVEAPYEIITDTTPETVIGIERGAVYFKSSRCDNQLCVQSGRLTGKGTAAACLPAKVVITVTGGNGVDAITY